MHTLTIDGKEYEIEDAVADLVLIVSKERDDLEPLNKLMSGWSGYAFKDGKYVDDIQGFFDDGVSRAYLKCLANQAE